LDQRHTPGARQGRDGQRSPRLPATSSRPPDAAVSVPVIPLYTPHCHPPSLILCGFEDCWAASCGGGLYWLCWIPRASLAVYPPLRVAGHPRSRTDTLGWILLSETAVPVWTGEWTSWRTTACGYLRRHPTTRRGPTARSNRERCGGAGRRGSDVQLVCLDCDRHQPRQAVHCGCGCAARMSEVRTF
jgi:hypothetical protein